MSKIPSSEVVQRLVELVDQLRQPYNNSKRSDLYWLATNALNLLEETGSIPPLDKIKTTPIGWPEDAREGFRPRTCLECGSDIDQANGRCKHCEEVQS